MWTDSAVLAIGLFVALAQVFVIISLLSLIAFRDRLRRLVSPDALWIAFAIALVATCGSLFFSNVMGYTPCTLCWYARILMYPLTVILGIAAFRRDWSIRRYVLPLIALGVLLTAYHNYIVLTNTTPLTPCSVGPDAVPCTTHYTLVLGYQSIPLMAFTAFVTLLLLLTLYVPTTEKTGKVAKKRVSTRRHL